MNACEWAAVPNNVLRTDLKSIGLHRVWSRSSLAVKKRQVPQLAQPRSSFLFPDMSFHVEAAGNSLGVRQTVRLSEYKSERDWRYMLKRLLWSSVQLPFWPKMPRRFSALRIFLLRLFGAKIGRNCRV